MAAVKYTKADWVAQADIQELANGQFQGVVLVSREDGKSTEEARHTVAAPSDSPEQALEQATALAHRLLADVKA